jgi:hypothetical protein
LTLDYIPKTVNMQDVRSKKLNFKGDIFMGYRKIPNLYKDKTIFLFRQCVASEKVHGTSAHISFNAITGNLTFFSGGARHDQFVALFDQHALIDAFKKNHEEHSDCTEITIYGEAYGGNVQRMKDTYGSNLNFIVFEVALNENWMSHFQAERIAVRLGFEFVPYRIIDVTEDSINEEMVADSEVAKRRGMGEGKMREGIVLRPLQELIHPNGGRIICKHKRPEFAEREHTPRIADPDELKFLQDAQAIADEWVTAMRLNHVLDKFPDATMEDANKIIRAMIADVETEGQGEIVSSKEARKAISKKTMVLFKAWLLGGN